MCLVNHFVFCHADWGARLQFVGLEQLYLIQAGLSGTIPDNWGTGTGGSAGHGMASLRDLRLDSNQLSGVLPASWPANGVLPASISLASNGLNGEFDAALAFFL